MIRILIADDHPLVRRGLVSLINATEDFELVGEAMHGLDAITMTERSRPDVVLMDLQMPRLNGVHATSAICRKLPTVKVLILTSFNEEDKVQQAMDAGAAGFMLKTATAEELVESIRSVVLGRMALSPEVVQAIVQSKRQPGTIGQDLTDRERDVLKLIVDGRSNADIGAALSITLPTVKFHVSSILSKLSAQNRTEAAKLANKYKIVPPSPEI
ncbi:MAG TPA: response regulator transcription factor [Thermoflexales bacterium]|nr:response regulator transcription factor [Thermoflexales bacterium]HQW35014.1 response regulator transcription factor [Thermoflexales bacterium]HQX74983.1 response regulator transcription factor [Thermoflexales bacterium]HQZ21839.1 response regulator transcription factor [Thermoflexales bacterium]HRA01102.1 response regulator transcription factor [Thermoflexales bacterium]